MEIYKNKPASIAVCTGEWDNTVRLSDTTSGEAVFIVMWKEEFEEMIEAYNKWKLENDHSR